MIKLWFPSKKIKRVQQQQNPRLENHTDLDSGVLAAARESGITLAEYWERDRLVKKEYGYFVEKGYHLHGKVRPVTEEDFERLGECEIVGVVSEYKHYGTVRWATSPLIMQIKSTKTGGYINCSTFWVKQLENEKC